MLIVVVALLMLIIAIIASMFGLGGGVLYTPIQVWAGIEYQEAAATSLFLIMVVSLSASLVFRKAKRIDWPLIIVLETATVSGGFLGGYFSGQVSGTVLSLTFAVVVTVGGLLMIRFPLKKSPPEGGVGGPLSWRRRVGDQGYRVNLGIGLPGSFLAGLVSGMVGVGGGILKVPLMVLLLGVPLDIAIGSSLLMIGLTAAAGFAGHVVNGHWDWESSLVFAAVVFVGGQIGGRISIQMDKQRLKKGFGWFMLFIALAMIVHALLHQ